MLCANRKQPESSHLRRPNATAKNSGFSTQARGYNWKKVISTTFFVVILAKRFNVAMGLHISRSSQMRSKCIRIKQLFFL